MRLDADGFEAVWQHICARALADHAQGTLIASFVKEDGHWIQAVQPRAPSCYLAPPAGQGRSRAVKSPVPSGMEEAHQPWGVLPHYGPGDLGSVGLVLRGRRTANPVAAAVDEFCRGTPVTLRPLGVMARRSYPGETACPTSQTSTPRHSSHA